MNGFGWILPRSANTQQETPATQQLDPILALRSELLAITNPNAPSNPAAAPLPTLSTAQPTGPYILPGLPTVATQQLINSSSPTTAEQLRRLTSLENASLRTIHRFNISRFRSTFLRHPSDTGSPEVQAAILTVKIENLKRHIAEARGKDKDAKRRLAEESARRWRILKYLRRKVGLTSEASEASQSGTSFRALFKLASHRSRCEILPAVLAPYRNDGPGCHLFFAERWKLTSSLRPSSLSEPSAIR